MKKFMAILGVGLLMAVLASYASRPVPIEQKLVSIQAQEALPGFDRIGNEPIDVQAAVLDLGEDPLLLLKAQAALLAYPDMARTILPLYASEGEFQEVLRTYGEHALPPIDFFLREPVRSIEWMDKAAHQYQKAKDYIAELRGDPAGPPAKPETRDALTPEERGWYAVNFIRDEGHDFLGQFVVDPNGETQWVQTERVTEGVTRFFTSGIRQLEANYRTGEEISAGDVGWASVDVLVFASAVKVVRAGRNVARATQGAKLSTRSAALAARIAGSGRLLLSSARYAKWPVIIGAAYLVVRHPSVINDFFAGVADVLGVSPRAIQIAGWLIILVPAMYIISWLLWPAIVLIRAAQGRHTYQ
ncbi:hypothetical protein MARLIPOL_00170 [Marinobacter lipolyticus SM19]|uniref:Uncharacterized protein n=1 Tax=Marinobacter lipolyticus SM19 TaxID=1318628 RepID=R8B683_9GAMM|nr:hypothetical protein [Marinobacter lipolyticus]EON94123.1 hypothetical protein MARLIPOL_00170 [Marinobacter lipolyticus SM19]